MDIGRSATLSLLVAPVGLAALFVLGFALPATHAFTYQLCEENHPVELLTFALLLWGGIASIRLAGRVRAWGLDRPTAWFYGLLGGALALIACEEVAWGQWFFRFETPAAFEAVNVQGETTLHNIEGMHGRTEFLRLGFGLGGLLGVALGGVGPFRHVAASPLLLPWFLVIVALAAPDLYNDFRPLPFQESIDQLSEVVELLIAGSALLFVVLNRRRLAREEQPSSRRASPPRGSSPASPRFPPRS